MRGIDHIVIAVRDLARAADDYARLGFTVTPGGEHTGGATHNALVSFADGAYFELIAFREPDRPQPHKWWSRFAAGEGTVDFALRSDDVAAEASRLRQAGIDVEGPQDGGRQRPDGQQLAWRNVSPQAPGAPLPFIIEDVTPRELRVPNGAAARHALGITGVAGVTLLVADLDRAASAFAALLETPGEPTTSDVEGASRSRRFTVGPHWIELVEAEPGATSLQQHIAERGAGPYEIVLAESRPNVQMLPLQAAHGARIRFTPATAPEPLAD